MTPAELVEKITNDGLASLRDDVTAGRARTGLVSLDERGAAAELVTEQYSGRYPLELIQNANDAAATAGALGGRVRLVLSGDALLAADQGAGFGVEEINAICGLARTSKDPRKTIGYKGLGFKSVREITDTPQIVSDGVRFGFDQARLRREIEAIAGTLHEEYPDFRVPDYAFPFPLTDADFAADAETVEQLRASGFRTVFRLPLRELGERPAVAHLLATTVEPRLLLFLDATETLELSGTSADFVAAAVRETHDDHDELILEIGDQTEHFLVFRREVPIPERALVADLGPGWHEVEAVRIAAAVPLDAGGRPQAGSAQPVHIYFPTEEQTGLALILNADFQVELDRRRISRSVHAEPYNEWLKGEMVGFVAETVVPALAERFDGLDVLGLLAQRGTPTGFGAELSEALYERLRDVPFLPCRDGIQRTAGASTLLPSAVPDPELINASLPGYPELLIPEAESCAAVRQLLTNELGVDELSTEVVLKALQPPPADAVERYYEMLVRWSRVGGYKFGTYLKAARCVRLKDGSWVQPTDTVFFPQQREDVAFPVDLGVPVADLPEVEDLAELLAKAGVRQATWRELIPQFLVPRLSDEAESPAIREQALAALRRYYESVRRGDDGDRDIRTALPKILLPARSAAGDVVRLRSVDRIYFGRDWLCAARLEELYGPFQQIEFLGVPTPADEDQCEADLSFYRWLGVADRPRIVQVSAWDPDYSSWRSAPATKTASKCIMGHPQSQRTDSAPSIDRLAPLIATEDSHRLAVLWQSLAKHWPDYEHDMLEAQWRCIASAAHKIDRIRHCPSPGLHMLTTSDWVPAERAGKCLLERPGQVWRTVPGIPKAVTGILCKLATDLRVPAGMAETLGLVDAARPSTEQITTLLDDMDWQYDDGSELPTEAIEGALWLLRKLNDLVISDPAAIGPGEVPLVATLAGKTKFTRKPYLVRDELLREIWADAMPVYRGDANLHALFARLDLPVLDECVAVEPLAGRRREELDELVRARLAAAAPALLVVAGREAPSRIAEIAATLQRLEPYCSDELLLQYSLTGHKPRMHEESSAFVDRTGQVYLRIENDAPDWWALGLRLAELVDVRAGDTFAILLNGDETARKGYFNAHRVSDAEVETAATVFATTVAHPDVDANDTVAAQQDQAQATAAEEPDDTAEDELATALPPLPDRSLEASSGAAPSNTPATTGTGESTGAQIGGSASDVAPDVDARRGMRASEPAGAAGTAAASSARQPAPTPSKSESPAVMRRFYSFVSANGSKEATDLEKQDAVAMALGNKGVDRVLAFERAAGREPVPQDHNNKGFDVVSQKPDGSDRRIIEIKATEHAWPERGIPVSRHQIEKNLTEGDVFWLYVVEHANDDDRARVIPIQNPVASVDYYVFDQGWEHLGHSGEGA